MMQEAETTLGLPPQVPKIFPSKDNPQMILSSNRTGGRPPMPGGTPGGNLLDINKQKRDEISQFLDQNGVGDISTISTGGGVASNNISTLQFRNFGQSSDAFNRTDMRIYHELFPGREIKAQRFFDLNTTAPMIRSPSFNKGQAGARDNTSQLSGAASQSQKRRQSARARSSSQSNQLRVKSSKNQAQLLENA